MKQFIQNLKHKVKQLFLVDILRYVFVFHIIYSFLFPAGVFVKIFRAHINIYRHTIANIELKERRYIMYNLVETLYDPDTMGEIHGRLGIVDGNAKIYVLKHWARVAELENLQQE